MKRLLLCSALLMAATSTSFADIVLDFEGLDNSESVLNFYNGGTSANGNSGTNYGIEFGSASLSLIDSDAGGSGNFANEPTPNTILFFLSGSAVMNVAAGFDTGFSFFYTNVNEAGSVTVYDGLNATGNVLASLNLPALGSAGNGDPTGLFDTWAPVGVAFAGTALSVDFAGSANYIGFDNITLGSERPGNPVVPLPPAAFLGLGLLGGLGLVRRVRRRSA